MNAWQPRDRDAAEAYVAELRRRDRRSRRTLMLALASLVLGWAGVFALLLWGLL